MIVLGQQIWSIRDVMEYLGVSRKAATAILNTKGCPVVPRMKGQKYLVFRDAFLEWVGNGGKKA